MVKLKRFLLLFGLTTLCPLAGCGQSDFSAEEPQRLEKPNLSKVESAPSSDVEVENSLVGNDLPPPNTAVSIPQIAYTYTYGYRIAATEIPLVQKAHADLCERSGPEVCHILNLSQSGGEGDYATGTLEIEVVAPRARSFGDQLAKLVENKGGDTIDTAISGEDLSRQIVDTEARLRARILLRDRLMEILRTRTGKVSELVEAERGVAAVNQEIDEAQSWLAEMKGRVSFSKITINYQSGSPAAGGFLEPIRQALGSAASMLGITVALIISTFIFLLPWAIILIGVLWTKRRFGWRFRFWEKTAPGSDSEPQP